MPARRATGLRQRLSVETHDLHEALHHHPRLLPLATGTIDESAFAALLVDYRALYEALEVRRAANRWNEPVDLSAPIKALRQDCKAFNACEAVERPDLTGMFLPETSSRCLGALYVLLGAQFGGRVLGAQLTRALPAVRSAYFGPCQDTLCAWRLLLALLNEVSPTSVFAEDAVEGARATFLGLAALLDQRQEANQPLPVQVSVRGASPLVTA